MRLATGLVDAELARGASVWHATVRLHASLAKMVGASGFDVLLARALLIAKKNHPILADFVAGPVGALTGKHDSANDSANDSSRDHVANKQAAVAVVACFVELLVVLIGEDLTMRLLHDVWQGASTGASTSATESKE